MSVEDIAEGQAWAGNPHAPAAPVKRLVRHIDPEDDTYYLVACFIIRRWRLQGYRGVGTRAGQPVPVKGKWTGGAILSWGEPAIQWVVSFLQRGWRYWPT